MVKTHIEEGFRIALPETMRGWYHVGDEVIVERGDDGCIVIAPVEQAPESLYPLSGVESPLGHRLREIRQHIVDSGAALLNWDALDQEIAERRGER